MHRVTPSVSVMVRTRVRHAIPAGTSPIGLEKRRSWRVSTTLRSKTHTVPPRITASIWHIKDHLRCSSGVWISTWNTNIQLEYGNVFGIFTSEILVAEPNVRSRSVRFKNVSVSGALPVQYKGSEFVLYRMLRHRTAPYTTLHCTCTSSLHHDTLQGTVVL